MQESSEKVDQLQLAEVVVVDLSRLDEAYGEDTTYYAGIIKVNGIERAVSCTDRDSWGWHEHVLEMLKESLAVPANFWPVEDYEERGLAMWLNDELRVGGIYEVRAQGNQLNVVDVSPPGPMDPRGGVAERMDLMFFLLRKFVAGYEPLPEAGNLADDFQILVSVAIGDWRRAKKLVEA